jgi:hypothetical protein
MLAGRALEQRDLNTAKHLTERVLSITEHRRPYLRILGAAGPSADLGCPRAGLRGPGNRRGGAARPGRTKSALLVRADELEAVGALSLLDLRTPAQLASKLPAVRRGLLEVRIALAAEQSPRRGGTPAAPSLGDLTHD